MCSTKSPRRYVSTVVHAVTPLIVVLLLLVSPAAAAAQCDPTAGHAFALAPETGMAALTLKALQRTPGKSKATATGELMLLDGTVIPISVSASVRAPDQAKTDYKVKAIDRSMHVGGMIRLEGCPSTVTKARLTVRTPARDRWKLKNATDVTLVATLAARTRLLDERNIGGLLPDQTDETHVVFQSGDATLGTLTVGSVLLAGVTSKTPQGMLRNVVDILPQGATTVVVTEPSTLLDAFDKLDIEVGSPSFRQAGQRTPRFNVDGSIPVGGFGQSVNHDFFDQGGGKVNLSGEVSIESNLNLGIHTSSTLGIPHLDSAHLEITGNVSAALQATASYAASVDGDVLLADVHLAVIYIPPILLTPHFKLVGGVAAGLDTSVAAEVHGSWSPMVGVMCDGDCELEHLMAHTIEGSVQVDASLFAEAFLRPELELALFDTLGAHVGVQPYGRLDADVDEDPWWTLKGGVKGDVGVGVSVLGHQIAGYDQDFTIFEIEILHATTPPPQPPPANTCAPTQAECEQNCALYCGAPSCTQAVDGQFCCVPAGQEQNCSQLHACSGDGDCGFGEKCAATGPCATSVCMPLCYGGVHWGCCKVDGGGANLHVHGADAVEDVLSSSGNRGGFKNQCESYGGVWSDGRCSGSGSPSCCIQDTAYYYTAFGGDDPEQSCVGSGGYPHFFPGVRCPYVGVGQCAQCVAW